MKLQKQVAYKYKDKTHYKYVIIIPEETIQELNWSEGEELQFSIDDSSLKVEKLQKV